MPLHEIRFNRNGGPVTVEITFGYVQVGAYALVLWDKKGRGKRKLGEGINTDQAPDIYPLPRPNGENDGSILDCLGTRIDAGVMATNTFSIAAGANGSNALFCNGVEIVPDIVNMQIVFGEDTNADLTADRYVALPDVTNINNVVSARIALLFQTPTTQAATILDTKNYDLNGVVLGPFNDLRIRRVMNTTINLRNRTP